MLMMDEEYGDYGFRDDPIILEELALEEEEESEPVKKYVIVSDNDEECSVPAEVIRLRDIKVPEGVKKRKRDVRIEMLRRLEQAARTVIDFQNLNGWYDYLEENERSRVRKHEILRNGDDFPLEYGENEDSIYCRLLEQCHSQTDAERRCPGLLILQAGHNRSTRDKRLYDTFHAGFR